MCPSRVARNPARITGPSRHVRPSAEQMEKRSARVCRPLLVVVASHVIIERQTEVGLVVGRGCGRGRWSHNERPAGRAGEDARGLAGRADEEMLRRIVADYRSISSRCNVAASCRRPPQYPGRLCTGYGGPTMPGYRLIIDRKERKKRRLWCVDHADTQECVERTPSTTDMHRLYATG